MRARSALSGVVLTLGLLPVVGIAPAAPAQAAPVPSTLAVVSQQDGGCATKDHILLANPNDGSLAPVTQPGKPFTNWGPLNEAKPIQFNRRIVGLWAGHSDGRIAGVGVYERATNSWPIKFTLPSTLQKGGPHSVARLPGDYFAVAHVGSITGTTTNGAVIVYDQNGVQVDIEPLRSAHGVEWDEKRKKVFAVGYDYVTSYDFIGEDLRPGPSWKLPGDIRNGHDLRRRRTDTKFYVTGDAHEWTFDPDAAAGSEFTPVVRTQAGGPTDYGTGVKSLDEGFDGVTLQAFWKSNWFFFGHRGPEQADFCMEPYKFRWIWNEGTPVYPEETDPVPATSSGPAEPFLWARKKVTTTAMPPIKDLWLGGATNTTADAAYGIVDREADAGNIPFIKFYHWGDDGTPSMKDFGQVTTTDISKWEYYAKRLAEGLGDRPGYIVMEPEYDNNLSDVTGACSPKFQDAMRRMVTVIKNIAENAVLINQSSFWDNSPAPYKCYAATAKTMHAQGFLIHISNTSDYCTERVDGHWEAPYYQYGDTATSSETILQRVKDKARWTREAFGTTTAFISDWAVTSCGWGGTHQAKLVDYVADAIPTLYKDHGLRGAILRTGPPNSDGEKYLGIQNENGFVWSSETTTRVNAAYGEIQTFLQSVSGTTLAFDAAASAPASVGPGQAVPIDVTVTNTGGSLSNGHIKIEVRNAANGIVDSTSFNNISWSTGQPQSRTWSWAGTSTAGTYSVHVGVFSNDWQTVHHWEPNAASFTVSSTAPPSFTSSASASPASVSPGATTTISATVTNTGSTLTGGELTIAVYTPNGALTHSETFAVTVSAGASATRQTSWTAPQAGGRYRVSVAVAGAGGTPRYHANSEAAYVDVGQPAFTSTATVSRPVVLPGASTTFTANVRNGGSSVTGAEVALEAYDGAGTRVGFQTWTGQTLVGSGTTTPFSWTWTTPTVKGPYTLAVGVFTAGRASQMHWNDGASAVTVADARLTSAVDTSPSAVTPGGTATTTLTLTNVGAHLDNAVVALDVYDAAGAKVGQVPNGGQTGQTIAHGETKTYSWTWTVPATAGTYTLRAGAWGAGWSPTYHYNMTADTVRVAVPAFTSSALVSSSNPAVGSSVRVTGSFTNTGGALVNGNVAVRVYDAAGQIAGNQQYTAQAIANGATVTYTLDWVPALAGTYTVKLGVWNTTWGTTHHWNNGAGTIRVGSTVFQPSFQVGDGANTWWLEVYTSNDVTGVDVIGDNGAFYLSLTKRSWGAWAATAPSQVPAGSLVRLVARRSSDGASAGTNNFAWLQAAPVTEPGWVNTMTKGSGASTTWVEVAVSPVASSVEVKVGTNEFTPLVYSAGSGKWGKAMSVPAGSKVVFRATNSAGSRAYSSIMTW